MMPLSHLKTTGVPPCGLQPAAPQEKGRENIQRIVRSGLAIKFLRVWLSSCSSEQRRPIPRQVAENGNYCGPRSSAAARARRVCRNARLAVDARSSDSPLGTGWPGVSRSNRGAGGVVVPTVDSLGRSDPSRQLKHHYQFLFFFGRYTWVACPKKTSADSMSVSLNVG